MVCLIFIGVFCALPLIGLGIVFLTGRGTRLISAGKRPLTLSYVRFLGVCCLAMGLGSILLSLIELIDSNLLVWGGTGIMVVAATVTLVGTFGPWMR